MQPHPFPVVGRERSRPFPHAGADTAAPQVVHETRAAQSARAVVTEAELLRGARRQGGHAAGVAQSGGHLEVREVRHHLEQAVEPRWGHAHRLGLEREQPLPEVAASLVLEERARVGEQGVDDLGIVGSAAGACGSPRTRPRPRRAASRARRHAPPPRCGPAAAPPGRPARRGARCRRTARNRAGATCTPPVRGRGGWRASPPPRNARPWTPPSPGPGSGRCRAGPSRRPRRRARPSRVGRRPARARSRPRRRPPPRAHPPCSR